MRDEIKARIERNQAKERYVKLTNTSREGAERLKRFYKMNTYHAVVTALIEQACAYLDEIEAAEGGSNAE